MPVVELHLIDGYESSAKTRLGLALTHAVQSVLPAAPDGITVLMHEMSPTSYMRGGTGRTPAPALPDPEALVRDFLGAMERRDLETARGHLAPGFRMTFPGGVEMTTLDELVTWAAPRYRSVTKKYERFDVAPAGEATVVYCFGTLEGIWHSGEVFGGIRFIDRFELSGGQIVRQDVWNDMGEVQRDG